MTDSLWSPTLQQIGAAGGGGGGGVFNIVLLVLLGGLLYLVMFRGPRKRQREMKEMQSKLEVGDEVITTSGIYGFIADEDEHCFWLLIDDEVEMRIARGAVQGKVAPKDDDENGNDPTSADGKSGAASDKAKGAVSKGGGVDAGDGDDPGAATSRRASKKIDAIKSGTADEGGDNGTGKNVDDGDIVDDEDDVDAEGVAVEEDVESE